MLISRALDVWRENAKASFGDLGWFMFYFRPDSKITTININNNLYFAKPAKFLYLFAIIMTNLMIELPGIPRGFPDTCFYISGKAQNKWRHYEGFPLNFFTGNRANLSRRPDSRTPAWLRLISVVYSALINSAK